MESAGVARERAFGSSVWAACLVLAWSFEADLRAQSEPPSPSPASIEEAEVPPEGVEGELGETGEFGEPRAPQAPPTRKVIAPWIVDVYGKNYESFTNEGASRVISDWLTNALIDLDLFSIVDRERIRAVLSERNLALSGIARDISRDVPENELATAAKLLSVNYILLGNVKNLGVNSEIDFKLLDVETTTYSSAFRLNFEIPFNSSIEKFKSVVDRVVAELAASFPITAKVWDITAEGRVMLAAGSTSGLTEGLAIELWSVAERRPVATGVLVSVSPALAEVVLDQPVEIFDPAAYEARVTIAPGPEAVLSNARLEIRREDFQKAREILAQGLEEYPEHGRILALHARSCWTLRDYEGAVGSYRDALKAEPNDLELLQEAARVFFEAGFFQELMTYLENSERTRETLDLELWRGDTLSIQGYPTQARDAYKRAFRLAPSSPRPHLKLAVLAARAGEASEVERELRLAFEAEPNGLEYRLAGAALAVLQADPHSVAGLRELIDQAVAAEDFTALAVASQILRLEPSLGKKALELAQAAVALNPAYLAGQILTAEAHALIGDREAAIAVLEEALETRPNNVAVLVRSGELLSDAGRHVLAELRLLQAQDLAPQQWRGADALGDSRFQRGELLKAVDAYQVALKIAEGANAPDLTLRMRKLGRTAVLANQHATAQPYLERCVALAPDDKECRYYLGLCYFLGKLPQTDNSAIVNLKASDGFEVDAYYYLGKLYDRRQEFMVSRDWYQTCLDAGCALARESEERIDEIDSIRGTVIARPRNIKQVSINVGRIHGVLPSQLALVISQGEVVGRIRIDQVLENISVAVIRQGNPLIGHRVIFRPTTPRGVTVKKSAKRGVDVSWRRHTETGLAFYRIYRKGEGDRSWKLRKQLRSDETRLTDKSVKPGITYAYRVVGVNVVKQEGLPSRVVEIQID
ncbi:MAG: tetratricopeptide repeat protein [Acidobacteria bacterium]|nr:tetratricopeptide repeat protein [Acidobacteriota bacterium]